MEDKRIIVKTVACIISGQGTVVTNVAKNCFILMVFRRFLIFVLILSAPEMVIDKRYSTAHPDYLVSSNKYSGHKVKAVGKRPSRYRFYH